MYTGIMSKDELIARILRDFVSMNINDLTRAEQNIMDLCCTEGKLLMPTNSHAEFLAPVSIKSLDIEAPAGGPMSESEMVAEREG